MSKIFNVEEAEKETYAGVYTMYKLVSKELGAKHFMVVLYDYEPNWSSKRTHLHKKRESVYIIQDGVAKIHLNGEVHELEAGSIVYLSPGDTHGVIGSGPKGLRMIEAWAPIDPDIVYFDN